MEAHEITTRLPPRREDEPASLRQDIVDEILDHLQCGLRRELLVQGGDEASARERVLVRFGDPREVARKLWYQAMWSQIMSQRIVVGSAMFSMVVCAALIGMMAWIMQQQQASAALQQQATATLLEHMAKLIPQPAPQTEPPLRGLGKSHLQIKMTLESKEGPPAAGWIVYVTKQPELGQQPGSNGGMIPFTTDSSGVADCGLTEPGRFEVVVQTPTREMARMIFTIPDDQNHLEHIVAPAKLPDMTKVMFRFEKLPEQTAKNSTSLVMRLRPHGSRNVGGHVWTPKGRWPNVSMPVFVVGGGEQMLIAAEPENSTEAGHLTDHWNISIDDHIKHGKWEPTHEWSLPVGEYMAQFGLVNLGESGQPNWTSPEIGVDMSHGFWLRKANVLEARPGQMNEWIIPLPDSVRICLCDPSKIPEAIRSNKLENGLGGGMGGGDGAIGGMGGGGFF